MLNRFFFVTLMIAVAVGLSACAPQADEEPAASDAQYEDGVRVVTIQPVGNEMRYAQTEFTVQAGEQVRIVFENTATSEAMHHNVVVVESRDDIDRVGTTALEAGPPEYIPEDDAILAYTSMAAPGETVEVTFTAPEEAGDYPYICTYPGHYMMMQGTMTVE